MQVYQTIHRGYIHTDFCEDFVCAFAVQTRWFVGIVSDGCSSGKDSHFASTLSIKLLRKIISQTDFSAYSDLKNAIKDILLQFIKELKIVSKTLQLDDLELLATILLVVYDSKTKLSYMLSLGDGVIVINDEVYEIHQDNMPDYPIYHKDDSVNELDDYFFSHYKEVEDAKNIAIATDGVLAFQTEKAQTEETEIDPLTFLLIDNSFTKNRNMLSRKVNILRTQYNLVPSDDVAIVRFLWE